MAVVVTLLLHGLAIGGWSIVQLVEARADSAAARRATASAEVAIDDAAADLAEQRSLLAAADLHLGDARRTLAAADAALVAASADHATVIGELEAVRSQLADLEIAVSGVGVQAYANASLVGQLATCLDGLSELVNQLAVGDRSGAVRTTSEIGPACAAVGAALP